MEKILRYLSWDELERLIADYFNTLGKGVEVWLLGHRKDGQKPVQSTPAKADIIVFSESENKITLINCTTSLDPKKISDDCKNLLETTTNISRKKLTPNLSNYCQPPDKEPLSKRIKALNENTRIERIVSEVNFLTFNKERIGEPNIRLSNKFVIKSGKETYDEFN